MDHLLLSIILVKTVRLCCHSNYDTRVSNHPISVLDVDKLDVLHVHGCYQTPHFVTKALHGILQRVHDHDHLSSPALLHQLHLERHAIFLYRLLLRWSHGIHFPDEYLRYALLELP